MAVEDLSDEQIERRLAMLEGKIAHADPKDLPSLNLTFQKCSTNK
jgi:hypothetical protein